MLIPKKLIAMAISEAQKAFDSDEVPVGSVISDFAGNIIASAHNKTKSLNDPTAHAEILAIRAACLKLKTNNLSQHIIYSTLEPCCMCASAIVNAKINRLYFGLYDPKFGGITNASILNQNNAYKKIEIYPEMIDEKAKNLLQTFFQNKRMKKN